MQAQELDALRPAEGESLVFDTNPVLNERPTHYCPGCHHGIAHRLVSEVLHELGVAERTILVASVGCATFTYDYFNVDGLEAPHGRACAVATGVRRARPDAVVFTYQGDGDMAAIGMAEIMAQLDGVAYSARCSLDSVKHVRESKKAMRKAFEVQVQGLGFGFIELLSGCPTNWHLDPSAANKRIAEAMMPVFPLGVYKDVTASVEADHA